MFSSLKVHMLKPEPPIPQNATLFGNRVLATGPPGKSLSLPLLYLSWDLYLFLLVPLLLSPSLSFNSVFFLFSLYLYLPILSLSFPSPSSPSSSVCHGGLCAVPHPPPPSAWTSPFILSEPTRLLRSGLQATLPLSATRWQQSIVLRAAPHPTPSSDWKQCAGQLQVVTGQVGGSCFTEE